MDFLLPDDDTMELMRKEFENLKGAKCAQAYALSTDNDTYSDCAAPVKRNERISVALLFLYFVKRLSYNTNYGTQIFDSDGSLGRLHSVESVFGKLNNLR